MKRPFSPVVWLCAAFAAALSVLPVVDPTGVYAGYTAALSPDTPVIAAVFTAAQDGVYPWSVFASAEDIPYSPAYRPLTGTVTDEEMRSSVGNDEPFREPENTVVADDELTPYVEVVTPRIPEAGAETAAEADGADDPKGGFITVDASWFDDAVFIGDSHIEGFSDYAGLSNATYYYKRGLDIWSVMSKPFVSGKLTIPQALSAHRFGKIYIMLGINEIGCGTTESYAAQYAEVIAQLRELQPDALIYIQAIFHTSQKKSDTTQYNNDRINARNEAISRIADGEHIFFVDCNAVFDDENGALEPTYTGDGVHVKAPYYTMWRDYLMCFGRSGIETVKDNRAPIPSSTAEPSAPANVPKEDTAVDPVVPEAAPEETDIPEAEAASDPETAPEAENESPDKAADESSPDSAQSPSDASQEAVPAPEAASESPIAEDGE